MLKPGTWQALAISKAGGGMQAPIAAIVRDFTDLVGVNESERNILDTTRNIEPAFVDTGLLAGL